MIFWFPALPNTEMAVLVFCFLCTRSNVHHAAVVHSSPPSHIAKNTSCCVSSSSKMHRTHKATNRSSCKSRIAVNGRRQVNPTTLRCNGGCWVRHKLDPVRFGGILVAGFANPTSYNSDLQLATKIKLAEMGFDGGEG